jgi:Brp/Blh family beta-carotene 15,15'-monooxygenase
MTYTPDVGAARSLHVRPRSSTPTFHDDRIFWPVVTLTVAVTAVAAAWPPPAWLSTALVAVVIAALGIPHGSLDHLVAEAIEGDAPPGGRSRFVRNYVAAAAGVGALWVVAPPLALALFLLLSIHHFGQSDLAHLAVGGRRQLAFQWSRGLFLVGLVLVAHLDTVGPIIERLGGGDPASWPWLSEVWWLWCALLLAQHLVVGAVVAREIDDRSVVRREVVAVAVLAALLLAVDPLLGFAVYFGLWHSLAHLLVLAGLLGSEPSPIRSVARLAAPLTVISLAGLAAVSTVALLVERTDLIVPIVVVFISMLTVPHMVVVERMWRRTNVRAVG